MRKIKLFLEAVVVITVALALVLPSSAVIANDKTQQQPNVVLNKIKDYKVLKPSSVRDGNVDVSNSPGDDIIPSITKDAAGNTVVTWTNEADVSTWNMGIAYSATPTDQASWIGYLITLTGTTQIYSSDTAYVTGPNPDDYTGLYGVNIWYDTELVGFYTITDVTQDPSDQNYWNFYSYTQSAPEPKYATVADGGSFTEPYNNQRGPVNMYIYHEIYQTYDIPDCPLYFVNDVVGGSGATTFFDGQTHLWTAPAKNTAMVILPTEFHLAWEYHNATAGKDQIVWKKIDPAIEADIEYTPFQQYVADGTNPKIAAYQDGSTIKVAVVYANTGNVKCVYSSDDGTTWSTPVTVAAGSYPAICAVETKLYCAYVNGGNLFLKTSTDGGATWSTATQINDNDGTVSAEENGVDIHPAGIVWVDTRDADKEIYYAALPGGGNNPPGAPTITGPSNGKPNKAYTFTFNAVDSDGDQVKYIIDWGDGKTDTTALNPSGTGVPVSHTWTTKAKFTITAKAQDEHGLNGPTATKSFSTPRDRAINYPFLNFLKNHPNLFPIIRHILGL